jgi:hypothetical protein
MTMNNRALIEAFETAGLQFIPENGGGPGVRFRHAIRGAESETSRPDQSIAENDH